MNNIRITAIPLFLTALASVALLGSCTKEPDLPNVPIERVSIPLTTKQMELVSEGNNLAFSFLGYMSSKEGASKDLVISPLSLQFLLGLLSDGASGQTLSQILSVLGYPEGTERGVCDEYYSMMMSYLGKLDNTVRIDLANAAFVRDDIKFKSSYEKMIGEIYDASVFTFPMDNPAKGVSDLNSWCSDKTNGMIPELIERVSPTTLAYIVNALYFKGTWKDPFDAGKTVKKPFTLPDGRTVKVDMMSKDEEMAFGNDGKCRGIVLPYGNGAYNMLFILPEDPDVRLPEFLSTFGTESLHSLFASMVNIKTDVLLPKFEISYECDLKKMLSDMGMTDAFNERADFSPMSETSLFVSTILQKARIKLDERGTEAAAVTAAVMDSAVGPGSFKEVDPVFHADRPFIYILYETSTSAILMCGQYCGENR